MKKIISVILSIVILGILFVSCTMPYHEVDYDLRLEEEKAELMKILNVDGRKYSEKRASSSSIKEELEEFNRKKESESLSIENDTSFLGKYLPSIFLKGLDEMTDEEKEMKLEELIKASENQKIVNEEVYILSILCYELTENGRSQVYKDQVLKIFENISWKIDNSYSTFFSAININEISEFYVCQVNSNRADLHHVCWCTDSLEIAKSIVDFDISGDLLVLDLLSNYSSTEIVEFAKEKVLKIAENSSDYNTLTSLSKGCMDSSQISTELAQDIARIIVKKDEYAVDMFGWLLESNILEVVKIAENKIISKTKSKSLKESEISEIIILIDAIDNQEIALEIAKTLAEYQREKLSETNLNDLKSSCHVNVAGYMRENFA